MEGMFWSMVMGLEVWNCVFPRVFQFKVILIEVGGCIFTRDTAHLLVDLGVWDLVKNRALLNNSV